MCAGARACIKSIPRCIIQVHAGLTNSCLQGAVCASLGALVLRLEPGLVSAGVPLTSNPSHKPLKVHRGQGCDDSNLPSNKHQPITSGQAPLVWCTRTSPCARYEAVPLSEICYSLKSHYHQRLRGGVRGAPCTGSNGRKSKLPHLHTEAECHPCIPPILYSICWPTLLACALWELHEILWFKFLAFHVHTAKRMYPARRMYAAHK